MLLTDLSIFLQNQFPGTLEATIHPVAGEIAVYIDGVD